MKLFYDYYISGEKTCQYRMKIQFLVNIWSGEGVLLMKKVNIREICDTIKENCQKYRYRRGFMKVIVFLDNKNGMMFNKRRQSRDKAATDVVCEICQGNVLWMNDYSYSVYGNLEGVEIKCCQDFMQKADTGEYALAETENLKVFEENIEELLVFRWNRVYPSDKKLELDLSGWKCTAEKEFLGNSHEKITLEKYTKL